MALWWARIETNLSVEMASFGVAACDGGDAVFALTPPEEHFRRSKQRWMPLRQSTTSCWGSECAVLVPFKCHFQAQLEGPFRHPFRRHSGVVTGAIPRGIQLHFQARFEALQTSIQAPSQFQAALPFWRYYSGAAVLALSLWHCCSGTTVLAPFLAEWWRFPCDRRRCLASSCCGFSLLCSIH